MLRAFRSPLSTHIYLLAAEMACVSLVVAGILQGLILCGGILTLAGLSWLSGRLSRPDSPGDAQTGREAVADALGADPWAVLPGQRTPMRHAKDPVRT